jgi:hypothetical protein
MLKMILIKVFNLISNRFNESFTFIGMNVDETTVSQLYIVILDDDKYGNDFLGATKVSLGMVSKLKM